MTRAPLQLIPGVASLIDTLDRVIDRGVRMDVQARASFANAIAPGTSSRLVVTSMDTCLTHCELVPVGMAIGHPPAVASRPLSLAESLNSPPVQKTLARGTPTA